MAETEVQTPAATPTPAEAPIQTPAPSTDSTDKPVGGLEGSGQVATPVAPNDGKVVTPAAEAPVAQPEKFDLKLSEGSLLKPEHAGELEAFAKAHGLSAKQAREVLTREESSARLSNEAAQAQYKKQIDDWRKVAVHDSEYGGEKLQASAEIAKRAVTKFGGEQMAKLLDETGYGNHPEVIRFMYRVGQAMSEGRMVTGGATSGAQIPIEDKFYKPKK